MSGLLEEDPVAFDGAEAEWSTGTIMAIFLATSMIAAVLFGLGYSFGLGATAERMIPVAISRPVKAAESLSHSVLKIASLPDRHPANGMAEADGRSRRGAASQAHSRTLSRSNLAAVHVRPIGESVAGHAAGEDSSQYMVQIGAISNRRDARRLAWKLRRKGFHAGIYPGKHDRYLHVQIGPFARIEQAEAVRHDVRASGFRATLKHAS